MHDRLHSLRLELRKGLRRMDQLDRERVVLRDTLLRIDGAIQVLEELAGSPSSDEEGQGGG